MCRLFVYCDQQLAQSKQTEFWSGHWIPRQRMMFWGKDRLDVFLSLSLSLYLSILVGILARSLAAAPLY